MLSPHETPLDRDKVMSLLSAARSGTAVVVKAQYSPDPQKIERTLVFAEQGQRLIKLADAWLAPKTYNEMISQLPDVSLGSCAAMYSTKPAYVWALRRDELRLWHSGSLVARFTTQESHVKGTLIGMWSQYRNADFASVHAFLSKTWVRRGVSLEMKLGRNVVIAKAKEVMALIDPTYDGIDIMCDAAWTADLARAIASSTGITLKIDRELL